MKAFTKTILIVALGMTGCTSNPRSQNPNHDIQRLQPPGVVDASDWGFSQAVVVPAKGHYVFIAGQFSGTEDGRIIGDTHEEQIKQTYKNLKTVIEASGAQPSDVVQVRVLIKDYEPEHIDMLLKESSALFGDNLPASTLIPVPRLAIDEMLFEIEATMFVPAKRG